MGAFYPSQKTSFYLYSGRFLTLIYEQVEVYGGLLPIIKNIFLFVFGAISYVNI